MNITLEDTKQLLAETTPEKIKWYEVVGWVSSVVGVLAVIAYILFLFPGRFEHYGQGIAAAGIVNGEFYLLKARYMRHLRNALFLIKDG